MARKISIKLPEGFHAAAKEFSEKIGLDIGETTSILVALGIAQLRADKLSDKTKALMAADALEAYANLTRMIVKAPKSIASAEALMQKMREMVAEVQR